MSMTRRYGKITLGMQMLHHQRLLSSHLLQCVSAARYTKSFSSKVTPKVKAESNPPLTTKKNLNPSSDPERKQNPSTDPEKKQNLSTKLKLKQSPSFGLDKKEKRQLRKKLLEASEDTQKQHLFRQLYPWKTKLELAKDLKESEVYNKDGLIALCKPYGIAQVKTEGKAQDGGQTVVQTLNAGGAPVNTPVLQDVIPLLKEMYNVKHLEIVKTTERWTSGLLLLGTKPEVSKKVDLCFRRSMALGEPPRKYLTVTNGHPEPAEGKHKVSVCLEYIHNIGKVPVIKRKFSRAEIARGDSRVALVDYSTLMHNKDTEVSLIKVSLQTLKWHFLRVWLAEMCCPILGDGVYGGRVKRVAGRKVKISPHNLTAYQPQDIAGEIYNQLELPEKIPELIPALIHMEEVRLCQFNNDKSDLILKAPPPEHFTWACKKLGIHTQEKPEVDPDENTRSLG